MTEKAPNIPNPGVPVELIYYEKYETKEEAMKREYAIKHMTRQGKRRIIKKWPCRKGDEVGH